MPTVRDDIEPVAVFPSVSGKKKVKRVSVYPAERWEKWGGQAGRFRLMLGETWVSRKGERVSFFTRDGVKEYLGVWALDALGFVREEVVPPNTPKGSLVWLCVGFPKDDVSEEFEISKVQSRTRTVPFVDEYGEWRVWVFHSSTPVLLADLRPRKDGRGLELIEKGD